MKGRWPSLYGEIGTLIAALALEILSSGCAAGPRLRSEFSDDQFYRLARAVVRNASMDPGTQEGGSITWMHLTTHQPDLYPALTEAVLVQLRSRFQVFTELDSVPPGRIFRTGGSTFWYRGGCEFQFHLTRLSEERVRISYVRLWSSSDWSIRNGTYTWTGWDWQAVEVGAPRKQVKGGSRRP